MDRNSEISAEQPHSNIDTLSELTAGTKRTATTSAPHAHRTRRAKPSYQNYIYKVFRLIGPELRISKKSIEVMNSFMFDMFERMSERAFLMVKTRKRSTLGESEIEAAAKLILGQDIFKECDDKYKKALLRYKKCVEAEQQMHE
ncbi:Histone_H2B [Hexamita inflata]|uniref:Histone H2B n=1 Tax=Hexamita inflata TaxID=28002 RepID=A0AA86TPM9_9EUKA|nr:Histone H2B [Hexamita inflata]CAI9977800.1 Histone H2B [Hexamita inflata]